MTEQTPWNDPNVQEAMKKRVPNDILLIGCERCDRYSYWNQGNHFTCNWCGWSVSGRRLDQTLELGDFISLEEYDEIQVEQDDIP